MSTESQTGPGTRLLMRSVWLTAALLLLVAVEARFLGIGARSLWFDEAFSASVARVPAAAVWAFLHHNDAHPPLYYILLGVWMRLFGTGEAALRSLSAGASALTVPLLYLFARDIVEEETALMAAVLLAGSAFSVIAAQEVRMYALLGLLALVSWWSLRAALRRGAPPAWAAYVMSSAAMLYTHYFGFFVIGAQVVYLLPFAVRDRRRFLAGVGAMALAGMLFLPWLPAFLAQATSGRGWPTYRPPVSLNSFVELLGLYEFGGELGGAGGYFHTATLPVWASALVALPIAALLAVGTLALRGEPARCLVCYLAVPVVATAAVSLHRDIFYSRYFSFLAPPAAVLTAAGLARAAEALRRVPRLRTAQVSVIGGALVVLLLAVNAPVLAGYKWRGAGDYDDWRTAARIVTEEAGSNDYLLFVPGFSRVPFEYYFKGSQERFELTPREIYHMVWIANAPAPTVDKQWVRRLARAHPRVWIIATVPLTGDAYLRLRRFLADGFDPGVGWDCTHVYVYSLPSRLYARAEGGRP